MIRSGIPPLAVTLLCLLALAAPVRAQTYTTPCPDSAPTWRLQYRMYPQDSAGRTVTTPQGVLDQAQDFADHLGELAECAVRVSLDIVPDAGTWTGDKSVPAGYDGVLIRYPADGTEEFSGQTTTLSGFAPGWRFPAIFPVTDSSPSEPNSGLLMHEWLHMVVGFYRTPLGWPNQDVHGACYRPDYSALVQRWGVGWPCMINPNWFSDLMLGRVLEGGQPRGLPSDQWARQGTPEKPTHRTPGISAWIESHAGGSQFVFSGVLTSGTVSFNDLGGTVRQVSPVAPDAGGTVRITIPDLGVGDHQACISTVESTTAWPITVCVNYTTSGSAPVVTQSPSPSKGTGHDGAAQRNPASLITLRKRSGRLVLQARGALVGRSVSVRFSVRRCEGCGLRHVVRRVRLRSAAVRLRVPRIPRGGVVSAQVRAAAFAKSGERYGVLRSRIVVFTN